MVVASYQGILLRCRVFAYICRTKFIDFIKNNFGAFLALIAVGIAMTIKAPFVQKQVEEYQKAEENFPGISLDLINEFFWDVAKVLFCLPLSLFELLSLTKSFMVSNRLVERVLVLWTIFFFTSAFALFIYRKQVDEKMILD